MPPKKRHPRHQPPPNQSDMDTDTAALTDAAIPAPPKTRTNTELNLLVLRRYNPSISHILQIAPFAVVYTFSPETGSWEKSGTEGTLFVCQLAPPPGSKYPRYNVVILNRKSLENFVADLTQGEDVELADPYVILQVKGADQRVEIFGLWIFDDGNAQAMGMGMQEIVAAKIQECAFRAEEGRKMAELEGEGKEDVDEQEVVEDYRQQEGGENGTYEQQFSLDGGSGFAAQSAAPAVQPVQPEHTGQPVDLLKLFGRPQVQAETHIPPSAPVPPEEYYHPSQQPMFASNADTDFFWTSRSPAAQPQAQQPPPPTQQNTLLDLLKSARPG